MKKALEHTGMIILKGVEYPYVLRRSLKAKRISIRINVEGKIEVVVPRWASYTTARATLLKHTDWLIKILETQQLRQQEIPKKALTDGAVLPYFGEELTLKVSLENDRTRAYVSRSGAYLSVKLGKNHDIRLVLRDWYRKEALQYATQAVRMLEPQVKRSVTAIRIMEAATRWGSCNKRAGSISFNWRLSLAPEAVARYVVVHEMAHLVEANHSQKFWRIVEELDSNAQNSRKWLRRYGHTLAW